MIFNNENNIIEHVGNYKKIKDRKYISITLLSNFVSFLSVHVFWCIFIYYKAGITLSFIGCFFHISYIIKLPPKINFNNENVL